MSCSLFAFDEHALECSQWQQSIKEDVACHYIFGFSLNITQTNDF